MINVAHGSYLYMKKLLKITIFIFIFVFSDQIYAIEASAKIRNEINNYYVKDKESLIYQDVVTVAQSVINNRVSYSHNLVAKAFSLLSDIAYNRGDVVAALQFAQYGTKIENVDVLIQLDLLLKVARGYYSQGKYIQLRDISQETAWLAEQAGNMNYHLQASAYSVVAYALSADYALAINELSKVEQLLSQNQQRVEQITLLEIIAEAHFYLAEYDNATELLNRVLKLRIEMSKMKGVARTYHLIASAYYQLNQYDDAYHAYYESKQLAAKFGLNIRASYAELGLGKVLYQQQKFQQAKQHLSNAQAIFERYNLPRVKLSTQILLAKVFYALNKPNRAEELLFIAEKAAENITLMPEQIELYLLLAKHYQNNGEFQRAVNMQSRFIELHQGLNHTAEVKTAVLTAANSTSNKAKSLALNLAEQSELSMQFNEKFYRQKLQITLLVIALILMVLLYAIRRFRRYREKLHQGYDEIELPKNQLARPVLTKQWYQQQYKMARKYQYQVSIAYMVIENWQELAFHFNAKILNDVSQAIAIIVNENLEVEDYSGEICAGEYLFLCPHQKPEEMFIKLTRIKQAINTRFFANLGDYSVKIKFSVASPNIQDIDPYVFLSRLSDNTEAELTG